MNSVIGHLVHIYSTYFLKNTVLSGVGGRVSMQHRATDNSGINTYLMETILSSKAYRMTYSENWL